MIITTLSLDFPWTFWTLLTTVLQQLHPQLYGRSSVSLTSWWPDCIWNNENISHYPDQVYWCWSYLALGTFTGEGYCVIPESTVVANICIYLCEDRSPKTIILISEHMNQRHKTCLPDDIKIFFFACESRSNWFS